VHAAGIVEILRRAEHQSIDDAEHRRVRTNAESEREDDRRGEARLGAHTAERVADRERYHQIQFSRLRFVGRSGI
jgi:hypothetical protein